MTVGPVGLARSPAGPDHADDDVILRPAEELVGGVVAEDYVLQGQAAVGVLDGADQVPLVGGTASHTAGSRGQQVDHDPGSVARPVVGVVDPIPTGPAV